MKAAILITASCATLAYTTTTAAKLGPEAICGDLGVMTVENLAEGVNPADLRMCADHPLGRNRTIEAGSSAPMDIDGKTASTDSKPALGERACYAQGLFRCSGRYCWKACGDLILGEWCWMAGSSGFGPWAKCSSLYDCDDGAWEFSCGRN